MEFFANRGHHVMKPCYVNLECFCFYSCQKGLVHVLIWRGLLL